VVPLLSASTAFATVSVERRFRAAPERLYDAWLDPAQLRRFLAPEPIEVVAASNDPQRGGGFRVVMRMYGEEVEHSGEYLELARPRRIVFTWLVPRFSGDASVVVIELIPSSDGGTLLALRHDAVAYEDAQRTEAGWIEILHRLATALGE
jgi:uncharacterized protein YndB with AHSA1/START domain